MQHAGNIVINIPISFSWASVLHGFVSYSTRHRPFRELTVGGGWSLSNETMGVPGVPQTQPAASADWLVTNTKRRRSGRVDIHQNNQHQQHSIALFAFNDDLQALPADCPRGGADDRKCVGPRRTLPGRLLARCQRLLPSAHQRLRLLPRRQEPVLPHEHRRPRLLR